MNLAGLSICFLNKQLTCTLEKLNSITQPNTLEIIEV